ncbi:MAG: HAD-IA family hydrolase [Chloroflexi bacterium]|nr:HAD-IA family hydrolase [Chloroflexota bacterium]
MSYNICIFDLDGTLIDPKLGITKSFQYALSSFGIHEELSNLTKFIGPPLRESFRNFYNFSNADTEKAVAKYREYFTGTGLYENTVYPDIPEVLRKLKEKGKTLAVATSKVTAYADRILKYFNLDEYFAFVSGDTIDGSHTKNGKRDIIRIVLNALNLERKVPTVMVGDRKHDIIGAREAGIDSIGNTWGYGSRNELESNGATLIVDSADELYCLIIRENDK